MFHCSGGLSGLLHHRFGLQCPRLHAFEFPYEPLASPSYPVRRRRRRYHRHYHRRVKFLHQPRPKCPKLPQPVIQPSPFTILSCRSVTAVSAYVASGLGSLRTILSSLALLPGLPVFLAGLGHYFCTNFILTASLYHFAACYVLAASYLAWSHRSQPFSHEFQFSDEDAFGSELPFSIHEGGLPNSGAESTKRYSDHVEDTILDLFCCIMAQSRVTPASTSWESVNQPRRSCFHVPGLDSFIKSIDPLADSLPLLEDEWDSIAHRSASSHLVPVTDLNTFVRGIDPLLYHRILNLDFGLSSNLPISVHYNSDPMSNHVFLTKSEKSHLPIVIDTGASRSISPRKEDFISFERYSSKIEGIGSSTEVAGKGYVKWKITDQHNKTREIVTFAYYIPSASIRLYSPQSHFADSKSGSLTCSWNEVRLYLPSPVDSETISHATLEANDDYLSFPYHPHSSLPCMLTSNHPAFFKALFAMPREHCFSSVENLRRVPIVEDVETFADSGLRSFLLQSDNMNLSNSQKELLVWHFRLGHVSMERLQKLMHPSSALDNADSTNPDRLSHPVVIKTRRANTHKCDRPKCQACILAKMTRRALNGTTSRQDPEHFMALSRNHCDPGDCVSTDQFVVTEKGRTLASFGKEKSNKKYSGGTIFKDHASNYLSVHFQLSLRAGETIIAKKTFERFAATSGVRIKKYHADNGVFVSEAFKAHVLANNQLLELSGVGGQHQNGRAERSIRTVFSLARALLIHSALYWPDAHDLELWPFAVEYAVWILNNLPDDDGLSPIEKFTRQKFADYNHLRRSHVWGAPMYVLDPTLQNGKKLPKFNPRSRQGKFVGFSKLHSSNVALVLNRSTGAISPQYHVVFDDYFQTVRGATDTAAVDLNAIDWSTFITPANSERYYDDADEDHAPPPLHDDWNINHNITPSAASEGVISEIHIPLDQPVIHPLNQSNDSSTSHSVPPLVPSEGVSRPSPPSEGAIANPASPSAVAEGELPHVPHVAPEFTPSAEADPVPIPAPLVEIPSIDDARDDARRSLRRSGRRRRKNQFVFNPDHLSEGDMDHPDFDQCFLTLDESAFQSKSKFTQSDLDSYVLNGLNWHSSVSALLASPDIANEDSRRFFNAMEYLQDPLSMELDELPTLALFHLASASASDNPRYHEAMSGSNKDGFTDASIVEISTLQHMEAWTQVLRTAAMNVLPSTWAFKIKRFPDGLIRKLKARFCVRGDKQIEGIDYFDTFAPVVQWSTVRLLLVLSLTLNLATKQVDYVSAFCQAPIDEDVYVELPLGWRRLNRFGGLKEKFKENHVLKLNRSVYGLKQSPKNFFKLLKGNLEKCGFRQSQFDSCLFISAKVICVCYVDDCLFFAPEESDIDAVISAIKDCNMDLQVEDSVAGFLGVHIDRKMVTSDDGNVEEKITLLQTGLTDRIIAALGLNEKATGVKTPAVAEPLPKDIDGEPFDGSYNYASVVGMCMYLCNNSRPDISFAISQCARFTHSPTQKHADYLKRVGRYLLQSRTEGLTMKCSKNWHIDCYVDADFAGLYNHEDLQDPSSVKSRTGYVIMVGGCPIIWSSKLQTEITLSTMESEYVACSTACRALIPLRELVIELANAVKIPADDIAKMHTTIWEDNMGALTLAKLELPRMTPRSKHISIKYHWFRSYVTPDGPKKLDVVKVESKNQIADIFTKGVGPALFLPLRKMMMGF